MSLLSRLGPVDEPALCLNTTRSLIDRLSEPVDDQPLEEDQLNVGEGFHKSADVDSQLQPEPSQFSGSGNRRSKTRSNSGSIVLLGNHSIGAGPRDTEHQNVLPASDLAADNLVAHLSKLDVINKLLQSMNATSGPADKSPPHPPPLSTLSPSSPEAMEECRRLMIPQLVQNAWLRDRSLDRNALERRVRELLTDEWCTEMVQSAKEVMSQMLQKRAGEAVEVAGECAAGLKRPREADDQEGPPRGAKSQRLESLAGASAGETTSSTSPDVGKAKSPGLLDTTILDSAVRAMEDYLDRSSVPKVNTQLASSAKSSSPTDIPTSVPISGRAEGTTAKGDGDRLETDDARHDSVARSVSVHSSPTPNCNHALHPTDIPTSSQQMEHNTQSVPVSPQPNSDAVLVDGSSAMAVDEQDTNLPQDHSEAYAPSPPPLDRVPGLWCVTVGSRIPDITDVSFEAEDEVATAAQRWVRRHKTFDINAAHVVVHLLCLPASAVAEVNQNLDPMASPADVAVALWNLGTIWPTKGTLVVEMNPDESGAARVWHPAYLGPDSGPLDITAYVQPGVNTIRLVQLVDMSECVFVVHATVPSSDEQRQLAARDAEAREWEEFLASVSVRAAIPTDGTTAGRVV